jgi:COMPASS component SWD1
LQFAAALYEDVPYLVDISEPIDVKYVLPSVKKRVSEEADSAVRERLAREDAKNLTTAVIYTATGDHILAGTNKGRLNIIDTKTREIIYCQKVASGVITTLRLSESGRDLLLNSQDRNIRTFRLPDSLAEGVDPDTLQLTVQHTFSDVVNRLSWNHVAFSNSGEYVAASTYNNHELYIWERALGSLVRMLEGPKEEQGVIEWHPHKAMLAACGLETGQIFIWGVQVAQYWAHLAPDFGEVEENVEYIEREDEFDVHDKEEMKQRQLDQEDEDVDVLTVAPGQDDSDQFRMPNGARKKPAGKARKKKS